MIAIPAVDLRAGACVQLVGGSFDDERVRLGDPVAVACEWAALGFRRLHVVDLDAAADSSTSGSSNNGEVVTSIVTATTAAVQVGGGVRSRGRIEQLLAAGAAAIVVGTRAFEDPDWLAEQAAAFPGRLIVAADVRGTRVAVRGWTRTLSVDVDDAVRALDGLPLGGVLVTAVDVEGRMTGPALSLTENVVAATRHPVIASGGVRDIEDLRALDARGADAAVIGMALYTGTLDARAVAREFGE